MTKQEDNIKTYLHMLGMQDQFYSTSYTPRYITKKSVWQSQQNDRLTDWHNKRQISMQLTESLPKLTKQHKKFITRSNSVEFSQYHSSLLKQCQNRKKDQLMLINPVVIKFNTKINGNALRRSQLLFHRILHNETQKKIQDPKKLRSILKCLKPSQQQNNGVVSPPKTQRCSGILRMLKRRQQLRILKRRKQNPQTLRAIKLPSK